MKPYPSEYALGFDKYFTFVNKKREYLTPEGAYYLSGKLNVYAERDGKVFSGFEFPETTKEIIIRESIKK
jgi:hypothetical protein